MNKGKNKKRQLIYFLVVSIILGIGINLVSKYFELNIHTSYIVSCGSDISNLPWCLALLLSSFHFSNSLVDTGLDAGKGIVYRPQYEGNFAGITEVSKYTLNFTGCTTLGVKPANLFNISILNKIPLAYKVDPLNQYNKEIESIKFYTYRSPFKIQFVPLWILGIPVNLTQLDHDLNCRGIFKLIIDLTIYEEQCIIEIDGNKYRITKQNEI